MPLLSLSGWRKCLCQPGFSGHLRVSTFLCRALLGIRWAEYPQSDARIMKDMNRLRRVCPCRIILGKKCLIIYLVMSHS